MAQMIGLLEAPARQRRAYRVLVRLRLDPVRPGVVFLQGQAQRRLGRPLGRVRGRVRVLRAGSAASAASLFATVEAMQLDPPLARTMADLLARRRDSAAGAARQ